MCLKVSDELDETKVMASSKKLKTTHLRILPFKKEL